MGKKMLLLLVVLFTIALGIGTGETGIAAENNNVVEKTAEASTDNGISQVAEAPKKAGSAVTVTETKAARPAPKKNKVVAVKSDDKQCSDEDACIGRMLLLYIPNRLIDITDIITLKVGFGPQARIFLTGTEFCNVGAFYGNMYYATKGYDRQWGGAQQFGWGYNKIYLTNQHYFLDKNYGSYNAHNRFYYITDESIINDPEEKPFKSGLQDFWRLGFELGWFVDLGAAIHPVDIADAVLGFFFIDIMKDDLK